MPRTSSTSHFRERQRQSTTQGHVGCIVKGTWGSAIARLTKYSCLGVAQGSGLLFGGVPAMLLVKKLVQVHDAFRLREEMLWMMGSCLVCVGKHHGVQHVLGRPAPPLTLIDVRKPIISKNAPRSAFFVLWKSDLFLCFVLHVVLKPYHKRLRFSSSGACCRILEQFMLSRKYFSCCSASPLPLGGESAL